MKGESKTFSLTDALTTWYAFLRVRSSELCDRAGRRIADFLNSLSRPQRIVLKATLTACLALLLVYSWTHSGPPEYLPSGKRIVPATLPLGAALFACLVSLLLELGGKK